MEKQSVLRVDAASADDSHNGLEAEEEDRDSVQFGNKAIPVDSLDKLTRLLSGRNLWLLNLIRKNQPQSVAELARLSGRPKASLTLTLRRLESFGIIAFRESGNRRKVPYVICDRLMLEVSLEPTDDTSDS
ncbi:MAG: MarR family transcriptional regulator [Hyphomicrobiaceae bacterium]